MTRLQVLRPLRSSASGPAQRLDVHLPYGCGDRRKDDPPVVTILIFDILTTSLSKIFYHVFLRLLVLSVEQAQAKLIGLENL